MLLAGLMFPYRMLPEFARGIAQFLPATHAMNASLGLSMGKEADFSPLGSIAVLFFGGMISFLLAIYLFSWDSQNSTRRGNPVLALLALLPYLVGLLLLS
jgi:ABC-type multidrug transport system permease subunit